MQYWVGAVLPGTGVLIASQGIATLWATPTDVDDPTAFGRADR